MCGEPYLCLDSNLNTLPRLGGFISNSTSIATIENSLRQLESKLRNQSLQMSFKKWRLEKIDNMLDKCSSTMSQVDNQPILRLTEVRSAQWFSERYVLPPLLDYYIAKIAMCADSTYLFRLLPLLSAPATPREFVVTFLDLLYKGKAGKYYESLLSGAYSRILQSGPSKLTVLFKDFEPSNYFSRPGYGPDGITPSGYRLQFLTLIGNALHLGLQDDLLSFLESASLTLASDNIQVPMNLELGKINGFVDAFITKIRHHFGSTPQPAVASFVSSLLSQPYHVFFRSKPIQTENWSQEPLGCGECQDCVDLDKFLRNPTERTKRFQMAQERRKHLDYKLDDRFFKKSTDKSKSPHTLIVTKTRAQYQHDSAKWAQTLCKWKDQLKSLQNEYMQTLLGDQYQQFVLFQPPPPANAVTGTGSHPLRSNTLENRMPAPPGKKGTKRKAGMDIIDLTEDIDQPSTSRQRVN